MTPTSLSSDRTAQRVALAEWRGWTNCRKGSVGSGAAVERPRRLVGTPPGRNYTIEIPRYDSSLDLMHDLEGRLTEEQKRSYNDWLDELTDEYAWHATAAQRCEALCRTLFPERFK